MFGEGRGGISDREETLLSIFAESSQTAHPFAPAALSWNAEPKNEQQLAANQEKSRKNLSDVN
jgi:hypothetical protein